MKLLMVRHGEIPSNVNKVYAGRSPETLTDKGLRQAMDVAEKLKDYNIQAIYSSPIKRALQTAEIIGNANSVAVSVHDAFREMEMGPWEGKSEAYIAREYPEEWDRWNRTPAELSLPGRETLAVLQKRVLAGIQDIADKQHDRNVVIVTHVAIIRVMLLWHGGSDLNLYKTIHVPNADIFEIMIPGRASQTQS